MAVNNSLVRKQEHRVGFAAYMTNEAVRKQVASVVGGKNGDKFISSIISAVNANPQLQECTNQSIVSAALVGNALNLSPSPQLGQFYLVPFNDNRNGRKVAQFQIGYKGMIQLAIRSGQYKKLDVKIIKEGEVVKIDVLNDEYEFKAIEDPEQREQAETVGYYAFFELLNGFRKELYWTKEQMEAHAKKYSQGYAGDLRRGTKYTFWSKDFDGMAQKTMLRQLISKWGIMSIEMTSAIDSDMTVINSDGTKDYVDTVEATEVEIEPSTVENDTSVTNQSTAEEDEPVQQERENNNTAPVNNDVKGGAAAALFGGEG
jgi:recombination protein RecT